MNRRAFVMKAGAVPLYPTLLSAVKGFSRSNVDSGARLGEDENPANMLPAFLVKKTNALAAEWDRKRDDITTAPAIEARNKFVREKCSQMIRGYPPRNPLNAKIVRVIEREGYQIESVMFESQPDFWVTASLYVPTTGQGPFPGIISPCGHYFTARLFPPYQSAYPNLVKSGFVVLGYDPIGEGERREFWDPRARRNEIDGPPTWEHGMQGQQLLLLGEDLVHYRVWDGMRAIDYLLSRPEVDPRKIGCAGHSGGGTLTMFISALDERVQCAVINEGGTENRWPLPPVLTGTGDIDQHFFPSAKYGIDQVDLQVAIAPRPLLATIEQHSPEFDSAARAIQARYQQIGVREKFATVAADDPHAWTVKLRNANTDWFCRWFYGRPGPTTEPDFELEPDESLYCTPNGSIRFSQQGQTIFSLILRKQTQLPPERSAPTTPGELASYRNQIGADIRMLLRYQQIDQPLASRLVITTPRKGYRIEKLEFFSEPGIQLPAWVFLPNNMRGQGSAILYVNDTGTEDDGLEFGVLEGLALQGETVVAVDVRGIGATRPTSLPEARGEYGNMDDTELALTYYAWEIDEELFGMRVQDVIRSVDYTLSRPDVKTEEVRVIGKGMGALWALYAAALDVRIRAVVCDEGLLSYRTLTQVDRYRHESSIFIRDVLKHLDLPQVAAAVADRKLSLLSPVDAMKEPADVSVVRLEYQFTERVYKGLGVPDKFGVSLHNSEMHLATQYLALLGSAG